MYEHKISYPIGTFLIATDILGPDESWDDEDLKTGNNHRNAADEVSIFVL